MCYTVLAFGEKGILFLSLCASPSCSACSFSVSYTDLKWNQTLTRGEIKHWPEGKSNIDQTGNQTLTFCKIKLWLAVKSKLCWPEVKPNTNPTIKSNTSRWSKVQYWLSLQLVTPDSLYCLPVSSKSNSLYVSPVVLLRCCCYFSPSKNTTNSKEKVTILTDAQACDQLQ